ncbi:MAG TPA: alpha-glucuronidase family glycosyl hydrolase [Chitinophagaceae bacterium]|nr:alpha-glucuronidase family glycosyl hydrolase [Chitinophagaceae bacterium]
MKKLAFFFIFFIVSMISKGEDGYKLWLRYAPLKNPERLAQYKTALKSVQVLGNSATSGVIKKELEMLFQGTLSGKINFGTNAGEGLLAGKTSEPGIKNFITESERSSIGTEGFIIRKTFANKKNLIVITGNTDVAVLYGVFHFIRFVQQEKNLESVSFLSAPKIQHRILNHWDNLNRYVERGYSGISIWNWHTLPGYIDQRYIDYARANASIGINGTVLTNVNANALVLEKDYLQKVAALAHVFRPYGIKVYLTARFSAPIELGKLKTADPLDAQVQAWWKEKVKEVYSHIPDFGGFLVKANSEGQPGPQSYGRDHAEGANMLADAVAPYGGIVMWRAFVYSNETPDDRFKQAYNEFKPLDGKFRKNVMVQVKNGPIDFQPREPFHPLFGAMPKTPLVMEYQLTQEYLGFSTHLVFLPSLFKEVLQADTYAMGKGSTVAKIIDGSTEGQTLTGMAGVSNIGNDRNWTGHLFAQANWYALGRLAWDHNVTTEAIADEWTRQTFTNETTAVVAIKKMLLSSHEAIVNYMTPLGLNHIMGYGHHYGPAPWWDKASRADWNPVYFHKADSFGIGFDRTAKGSNALQQYSPEARAKFENIETCPDEYLLWFHHASWKHKMKSGRNLWEELCYRYNKGVDSVRGMQKTWSSLQNVVDKERFEMVNMLLAIQEKEASWWRDACLLYFQTFSKMPIPASYKQPKQTLEYFKALKFPYAPGNYN